MKTSDTKIKCFRESSERSRRQYRDTEVDYLSKYDSSEWFSSSLGFVIPVEKTVKEPENKESQFLKVDLLGKIFAIPAQLKDIADEIIYSEHLLDLEFDWNFDGGLPVEKDLYLKAVDFLLEYSQFLLNKHGVTIVSPEINLCPNGSIDLSWVTENARLLINIKKGTDNYIGRFYGYTKSSSNNKEIKIPKEGFINMDQFDDVLAIWMKSLT